MRYWLDTEFRERPGSIDLISIGIVAEDGRELYAENALFDWRLVPADDWLQENVRPHLEAVGQLPSHIREAVLEFVGDEKPEFWGYYCDYDWVVFCWLFGRMIDLPAHYPKFCRDLKQWAVDLGNPNLPKQDSAEHHALADARWNRSAWYFLHSIAGR